MVKTLKYNIVNFRHIRNCLSLDAAKTYMHAMILSHMVYCITCWGQASESGTRPLASLYKQTLKTLDKKPMHFHHCKILEKYRLLSFEHLRQLADSCMVYKIINGLAPPPLCDFVHIRPTNSIRATRTVSALDCVKPFRYTVFGQSSFSVKAITQWNSLPEEMRRCSSIDTFKAHLKGQLLASQSCSHFQ